MPRCCKEGDTVCAVESDKASVELSSPYTGTVQLCTPPRLNRSMLGSRLISWIGRTKYNFVTSKCAGDKVAHCNRRFCQGYALA
eukprot:1626907-Amphidinium_carterae.1